MSFAFDVEPNDHAESPSIAYSHINFLLTKIAESLGKSKEKLRIYDPYYCDGTVIENLNSLGYSKVHNRNEDFYSSKPPKFDVLVTNPPYSGDHVERLLKFCTESKKPFLLLLPNWVYLKPYWTSISNTFYICPRKRYIYKTPTHLERDLEQQKKKKKNTSPFVTFWFCGNVSQHFSDVKAELSKQKDEAIIYVVKTTDLLPMELLDQYDPTYKRLKNRKKSEKRARGDFSKGCGGWGHKGIKKTVNKQH
jgi:hypothetical protein